MILDVRTPEEFLFAGHPTMGWMIPVAAHSEVWDAGEGQFPLILLPDFVSRVKEVAKTGDIIMAMCRSGALSAIAVILLAKAGFAHVYNIIEVMEGNSVDDPTGTFLGLRLKSGWRDSGCPWTYDASPERMSLSKVLELSFADDASPGGADSGDSRSGAMISRASFA